MTKVELYKSRVFVTIIHLFALGQFAYGLFYNKFEIQRSAKLEMSPSRRLVPEGFGQKVKFFTFWNLIIQTIYYVISLINDFLGTNEVAPKHTPTIRKVKDYLMSALAFPVALNVGITFWTLYAIDRELVLPRVLDPVFPSWLNHVLHTNVVVFMILELFTSFRAYPKRSTGLAGLSAFIVSYLIWLHVVKYYSGFWVYPVLEVLLLPQRIVFFVAVITITLCLYLFGEFMNNIVWEKELKLAQRKVK
ncbi:androgen-induced gene 1 protein isoform X2 [Bactrocera oleae]|uniref:androgen-induced gene 1 protein isoform X2 n=1 Tax=Bactrocera oleae TaxID=104688 RepID=UPI0006B71D37|nr:androgen-induced gene 1 protein isoform X2 [Bactrocera oleae]XP_036229282.1 androgen-induced gene 1 protein isoform X2 [Bactrocera oleae]XP_036229291.1 androgen-induced gene 1 protein isoform X2 [Bactrocera oleae]XP_036229301.1 androgen-induced gene 1 protein isoform X2 [Bactrocera oleae]XP_036229304.1 androgen-induced gene 1 protein isoform X2 [Bactrocera oleae]XP_036229307.1 androgen-induced gene 1 protein isoform X2 [Bactrocera oleae]XP_036229313.1 androgen-induced gene 1 protein isofor